MMDFYALKRMTFFGVKINEKFFGKLKETSLIEKKTFEVHRGKGCYFHLPLEC